MTNTFAAPVVKIQSERKHQVISTGPYAHVRHPMYSGAVPTDRRHAASVGSWYGLFWSAALIALLAYRAVLEETMLKADSKATTLTLRACATGWCRASGKGAQECR